MGKKEENRRGRTPSSVRQGSLTLREESSGRKQTKGGSNNVKSILKKQHLQNLAVWAAGEASIPSLGALYGHRLANCAEAMGTPLDPSLFLCQRCESILQPGYNCTIRIEKNRAKVRRRRKKLNNPTQNNVVYTCHFCSERNLKKGMPKDHKKEICLSRPKPASELELVSSTPHESTILLEKGIERIQGNDNMEESISLEKTSILESKSDGPDVHLAIRGQTPQRNIPVTPLAKTSLALSEGKGKGKKRKKRGSGSNQAGGTECNSATADSERGASTSSKRKRKSWTTLKEMVENSERQNSHITNLSIPFFL
ncbi:hypothetical protein NE237_027748 [Protea cynaroides]|uniref:Uncharacterized protein n=1 Tax=Protea cynaroides TaxID=273540 RepID=A0A9Q0GN33_9MAGN|nr:hypothetical protein NE237_027748 [Protea cynaroides]